MNFRIYDKFGNYYLDDSFVLCQDGRVIDLKDAMAIAVAGFAPEKLDPRNFVVEPSTGLYDSKGAEIFAGDILRLECFDLNYEVVWHIDKFMLKPLYEVIGGTQDYQYFRGQKDLSEGWIVTGNIHEYNP